LGVRIEGLRVRVEGLRVRGEGFRGFGVRVSGFRFTWVGPSRPFLDLVVVCEAEEGVDTKEGGRGRGDRNNDVC